MTVLLPIIRIVPTPFLLADPLILTILCVMTKLIPLPGCFSRFLAFFGAAVILISIAGDKKVPQLRHGTSSICLTSLPNMIGEVDEQKKILL